MFRAADHVGACRHSRTDWLPTRLNRRIAVTFVLVSWRGF
jgi:hypothetical protein